MIRATSTFTPGNITGILARVRAASARGCEKTANHVLQQAQVIVPIRSGELYESGNVTTEPDVPSADVNFDSDHAVYVEFGTYKMRAQPYLRPAMDAAHDVAVDDQRESLEQELA